METLKRFASASLPYTARAQLRLTDAFASHPSQESKVSSQGAPESGAVITRRSGTCDDQRVIYAQVFLCVYNKHTMHQKLI